MKKQRWEKYVEYSIIGTVLFLGLVSLLYSWIDSAFNVKVNVYLLTAAGIAVTALIVYVINVFDKD